MAGKILITGGAGFIGSHLVELLLKEEPITRIRLLIPKGELLQNLPRKNFDIVWGDIRDKRAVQIAMKDVSVVYHLAAKTIPNGIYGSDEEYMQINVQGTKNLLGACRGKRIRKFIFFSSIAVFGLPAWVGDMVNIDESYPKNPVEIYGRSKLAAENTVIAASKKWGIPYVIIRPTTVYGPRDRSNLLGLYKAINKNHFFFIGDGKNKMDYVFVNDVVTGARLAEKSKIKNVDIILGASNPLTLYQIASSVAHSIKKHLIPFYMPRSVGLGMSYIMYTTAKIYGIQSPLFPARVKVLTANCYFNSGKARRIVGYKQQITFMRGTRITAKWLTKNKYL